MTVSVLAPIGVHMTKGAWMLVEVIALILLLVACDLVADASVARRSWTRMHADAHRRNVERNLKIERERFQRDPRVGERAGYLIYPDGTQWMVGEVISLTVYRDRESDDDDEWVGVRILVPGSRAWECSPTDLTWFPPSTTLGRHDRHPDLEVAS